PEPFAGFGFAPTPASAAPPPAVPEPAFAAASAPPAPPPPPGYVHHSTIWFNPQVLQYVAPVSVVLIFILQLFPWVGIYPGGVPVVTQGAWGAAFGSYSVDHDLISYNPFQETKDKPGVSVLTI